MSYRKSRLPKATLTVLFVLVAALASPQLLEARSGFKRFSPPDEKGPYNVGIRTFEGVPMSAGRLTRVQVYYPTKDSPNCQTKYTVNAPPRGLYQRSSPLCASQDANPAQGPFPLIVHDHGGGAAGADHQRLSQLPVHETLASHGFVVALALHSANEVARVVDLPLVINFMLSASNPLSGIIDSHRIGLSGFSAGARAAFSVPSGWTDQNIPGDPRIKAMVLYEGMPPNSLTDAANITIPYLMMGGDRFRGGLAIPETLDTTVLATPRIFVLNPEAVHFSYQTDLCTSIEETREAALMADPAQPEPLTNMIPPSPQPVPPSPSRPCNPAMGAAAFHACTFWNQGELFYFLVDFAFGGGRNTCDRVGVNSIRSLDTTPMDGFTDATESFSGMPLPLFEPNDNWNSTESTVENPPTAEIMVPLIKHYTVAFWKRYLEGDRRYKRFLTPRYAERHDLNAVVEFIKKDRHDDDEDDDDDCDDHGHGHGHRN